jgi:hypothetical protein
MKPGLSMIELCEKIENGTRTLIEENGLNAGRLSIPLYYGNSIFVESICKLSPLIDETYCSYISIIVVILNHDR